MEWRRKGNNQQGEGTATMGGNGNNKDNVQQLHNYKSTFYAHLIATKGAPQKLHGETLIHRIST
jgi:hypothetical protein